MTMVIVPDFVKDKINRKLDDAFKDVPDAEKDRNILYQRLLGYFDTHGVIPDIELRRKEEC